MSSMHPPAVTEARSANQGTARLIAVLFFFSGLSSLIYQVLWMRRLSLFFGSDVYSATVTLSCFMGGLSLGGLAAGRLAQRLKNPLFWYGVLELGIGACAYFFNAVLSSFFGLNQAIYLQSFVDAPWRYQAFRVLVAASTLLLPTSMMGATLPLIVRRFVTADRELGRFSGFFYAVNTFGALVGVLSVGFALLPNLGVSTTTRLAVAINALVGLLAIGVGLWTGGRPTFRPAFGASAAAGPSITRPAAMAGLMAIGVSGMSALALEVVWTRILIQSYSATVYSFSIMLCCFLFGIFYGSKAISARIDVAEAPLHVFAYLELALGVSVAALGILSFIVPSLFGNLLWTLTGVTQGAFGPASVIAEFLVSGLLIAIPTMLMGATFPAAVKACTASAT